MHFSLYPAAELPLFLNRFGNVVRDGKLNEVVERLSRRGALRTTPEALARFTEDEVLLGRLNETGGLWKILGALQDTEEKDPIEEPKGGKFIFSQRPVPLGGREWLRTPWKLLDPSLKGNGMTIVEGNPAVFLPPLPILLQTDDPTQILQLLEYAGISYLFPESDAAKLGVDAFRIGRQFVMESPFEHPFSRITFAWDGVLGTHRIFKNIVRNFRIRRSDRYPYLPVPPQLQGGPDDEKARQEVRAFEAARPLMHELAFGFMVGFAIQQGLTLFTEWERYQPQVGLTTAIPPEQLGVLAQHFPILSLMGGCFPGLPESSRCFLESPTFVHLGDFLKFAERLLIKFEQKEFEGLTRPEQNWVMAYFETEAIHDLKPVGAMMEKWGEGRILLFDDSFEVIRFFDDPDISAGLGIYLPTSGADLASPPYRRRRWWEKILPFEKEIRNLARIKYYFWQGVGAAKVLAEAESTTPGPFIVKELEEGEPGVCELWTHIWNERNLVPTPKGTLLQLHEVRTSLQRVHETYVAPIHHLDQLGERILQKSGGIRAVRERYHKVHFTLRTTSPTP